MNCLADDRSPSQAVVWINDYPQKARWKVTNKETMVHVRPLPRPPLVFDRKANPSLQFVESTGASITFKGIYYEPGKEPGPNDVPKLHLLIESNEELRVRPCPPPSLLDYD